MTYSYTDIDSLLNDVILNKVGVASLSNELIEELLCHITDIILDKNVDHDGDSEKLADVLEKVSKTMEYRITNESADDFTGPILDSVNHGNFQPIESNFTLH
jgi:hypothetical protein